MNPIFIGVLVTVCQQYRATLWTFLKFFFFQKSVLHYLKCYLSPSDTEGGLCIRHILCLYESPMGRHTGPTWSLKIVQMGKAKCDHVRSFRPTRQSAAKQKRVKWSNLSKRVEAQDRVKSGSCNEKQTSFPCEQTRCWWIQWQTALPEPKR